MPNGNCRSSKRRGRSSKPPSSLFQEFAHRQAPFLWGHDDREAGINQSEGEPIMEDDRNATEIGRQLGCEGVERVVSNAERFCEYAGQEIELTNHPRVLGLRAELS